LIIILCILSKSNTILGPTEQLISNQQIFVFTVYIYQMFCFPSNPISNQHPAQILVVKFEMTGQISYKFNIHLGEVGANIKQKPIK
jgi:hypothetical protein